MTRGVMYPRWHKSLETLEETRCHTSKRKEKHTQEGPRSAGILPARRDGRDTPSRSNLVSRGPLDGTPHVLDAICVSTLAQRDAHANARSTRLSLHTSLLVREPNASSVSSSFSSLPVHSIPNPTAQPHPHLATCFAPATGHSTKPPRKPNSPNRRQSFLLLISGSRQGGTRVPESHARDRDWSDPPSARSRVDFGDS